MTVMSIGIVDWLFECSIDVTSDKKWGPKTDSENFVKIVR